MTGIGILEAAVIAERERIIKLLQDKGESQTWFLGDVIALIKGENK